MLEGGGYARRARGRDGDGGCAQRSSLRDSAPVPVLLVGWQRVCLGPAVWGCVVCVGRWVHGKVRCMAGRWLDLLWCIDAGLAVIQLSGGYPGGGVWGKRPSGTRAQLLKRLVVDKHTPVCLLISVITAEQHSPAPCMPSALSARYGDCGVWRPAA